MKIREWIVLPLLAIAVSVFASMASMIVSGMKLSVLLDLYDSESGSPGLLVMTVIALIFLGIPGLITDFAFRKYPERVRLSPVSFGLIIVIPLALIPCLPCVIPFLAGNAVIAATCLCTAFFHPGKRLGEFEKIPVGKTVLPFFLAGLPLWCILIIIASKVL